MKRILVTGALGQIGAELTHVLREKFGADQVLATDLRPGSGSAKTHGPFETLDVTQAEPLRQLVKKYDVGTIYHLAAILSVVGEKNPTRAWDINMSGLLNVLECARLDSLEQIFWPSSIGVFGPESPRDNTPQETVMRPATMYGITKVSGELLCDYYVRHFGLDIRGIRFPGVISADVMPGGGTTDYAVEIFYSALRGESYTCFVSAETVLPMIYMPDCLQATLDLMAAPRERLRHHNSFNIQALSFSAQELAAEIRKHVPNFVCHYRPDHRQQIADSWPRRLDDSAAREEWNWRPRYDLAAMTADMLKCLSRKLASEKS